jgi:predicted  nucleic acid-binding Zn-ribbon protein
MAANHDQYADLSKEIEQAREQLVRLVEQLGFLHPTVQHSSTQLDILLLRFYESGKTSGSMMR